MWLWSPSMCHVIKEFRVVIGGDLANLAAQTDKTDGLAGHGLATLVYGF